MENHVAVAITLSTLLLLYVVAIFGLIVSNNASHEWWVLSTQLLLVWFSLRWGNISVPINLPAMQVYIAIMVVLCFVPVLFINSIGIVSFPIFLGWAAGFGRQVHAVDG
ncbi:MAG: hypothetical protein HYT28_02485 [Parcubacteria group bacterium]|nr:hypothetical protein [Parcubacteria group bacterium]